MSVGRKVGRNPVDNDSDPRRMKDFHEFHEVMRRTKSACGSKIARGLVTPRAIKRELVDRHQFDMRIA